MLVLTRKIGEKLVIGQDIVVTVLEVRGNHVKIGIEAPDSVKIVRAELIMAQPDTPQETATDDASHSDQHNKQLAVLVS